MEGGKIESNKKKENTIAVSGGRGASFNGGGLGGIVVLGGALAFAALFSFFANKKNKNRPTKKDQSKDSDSSENMNLKSTDDASEGLQLLVQPESSLIDHLNPCCKRDGKSEMGSGQFAVDEIITNQKSIPEEIRVPEINGGKETLQNGDLINPGSISLSSVQDIENENHKLQVIEISSAVEEEPEPIEVIGEEKQEDEDSEIAFTEHVEPNPSMNSVEEEEHEEYSQEVEDEDEDEEEKSKGSSEETVDSTMESNVDLIWPAEVIDNLSMALKDHKDLGAKVEEDGGTVGESKVISNIEGKTKAVNVNSQPLRRLRMFILGTMILLVLLILITRHEALFWYLIQRNSVL